MDHMMTFGGYAMNRTREIIHPTEALKLIAATLNSPSIRHERIEMTEVYNATAAVVGGNPPARILSITSNGVVIEGLTGILAAVHAWKPVPFDVARGVRGVRAYERKGPKRANHSVDVGKIEHSISILDSAMKKNSVG